MFSVVVPTVSSLTLTPSTSIFAVRPYWPAMEIDVKPFLVGSKLAPSCICTPGVNWARLRKFCPLIGRFLMSARVSTFWTVAVCVFTATAVPDTWTTVLAWPTCRVRFPRDVTPTCTVIGISAVMNP